MATRYYNNKMYGKVTVYGVNSASLPSFIWPKLYENLSSQITVRRRVIEDLDSSIWVPFTHYMPSSINITHSSDLHCSIKIKPNNRMHGIVEVIPPTLHVNTSSSVKDAFVRSMYPRLNYGDKEELYIGRQSSGDTFRTYLEFNVQNIEKFYKIKQASIQLNTGLYTSGQEIGLYKVNDEWTETGITWRNEPEAGDLITTFTITSPVTEINILDYAKEWQQEQGPVNLCLKAINEVGGELDSFASRETDTPPQLVIKYTNPLELWYYNKCEIYGTMNVVGVNKKDLPSRLEIPNHNVYGDLPSSIDVKYPYILPGELTVSKVVLPGSVWPKVHKDLGSSLYVRFGAPFEMDSSINVNRKEIPGTIAVPWRYDVPGDMTVRGFEHYNIPSFINVNRKEMPGSIHPIVHEDVPSEIIARLKGEVDYPGWIGVSHKTLPGSVWPIEHRDTESQVLVRLKGKVNLPGSLKVRRPGVKDIPSKISVFWTRDTESSLSVRKSVTEDMAGWLGVNRKDLPAHIVITYSDDLNSSIGARVRAKKDLPSVVKARRNGQYDTSSSINVVYSDDLTSQISVRRSGKYDVVSWLGASHKEITGMIWPRVHFDIPGMITCKAYGDSDLHSKVGVRRIGYSDLEIEFLLRQFNASDLECRIELKTTVTPYAFIM